MSLVFTTEKSPDEIKNIISKQLKRSSFFHWHEDVYIGNVSVRGCRYTLHRAYIKNSFQKSLIAKFVVSNGYTQIRVRFISALLNWKIFAIVHIFLGYPFFIRGLESGDYYSILEHAVSSVSLGIPFDLFFLIIGGIVSLIPQSEGTEKHMLALIKDNLDLKENLIR